MSEIEESITDTEEFTAIAYMIKNANEQGLLCEVIWSLCHNLSSDADIVEEIHDAQNEWDI